MLLFVVIACASDAVVLTGGTVVGQGEADIRIEGSLIVAVGKVKQGDAKIIDVAGRFLVPAAVDTHTHLAYLPRTQEMADGGVGAVVDWAAPLEWLDTPLEPLERIASGPMITGVDGYPTTSWGRDGYGIPCADGEAAVAAVGTLADAGAGVIKLAITTGPRLEPEALTAAAEAAHTRGLKVGAHALSDADASLAADIGADILVHTPTEALSDATVAKWKDRVVITSVAAFGGGTATVDNLRRLREAGATILYGTDFGNQSVTGISSLEVSLMEQAGMDGSAILASMTTVPAQVFMLPVGIEAGKPASLLVLAEDPTTTPAVLATPEQVWIRGDQRRTTQSR